MSLEEMVKTTTRNAEVLAAVVAATGMAAARASAAPQQAYIDQIARCPVVHAGDGQYAVFQMDDLLAINKSRVVEQASKYLGGSEPAIPLGLDGDEHRKYRRLLDPVFTAKRVAPLGDKVRELANEMIDSFIANGEVDAYHQWCEPLPSTIFLSIMGLPLEDLEDFLSFKRMILTGAGLDDLSADEQMAKRVGAVVWIQEYFNRDLDFREQEAEPRDDMISWLLNTEVEGERLSRSDMLSILGLLMIAGLDTVAASLACFLSYLARNPDRRAEILADPELIPGAVEELMRFESPVVEGTRLVLEDLTLPSGTTIPGGSAVLISWHGANVDPGAFPNPLEVDFHRAPNAHVGFASGFHRCLGSHLARLELRIALQVWHERIPNYSIKPGVELSYAGNPRTPHFLPLVW